MDGHKQTLAMASWSTGSLWWLWERAVDVAHGAAPPWVVVPPLVFSAAALVTSLSSYLDKRQERRHKEQTHRVNMQAIAWRPGLNLDQIEGRGG